MTSLWIVLCYCSIVLFPSSSSFELDECDPANINGEFLTHMKHECLVKKLFDPSRYSPLVRPVENINETLHVEFSVQLSQIVSLDEKNQVMKTNVWLQLYWNDYQLVWKDDRTFNDVTVLRINPEHVWRPDVVLFNNADGKYEVSYMSNVLVYKEGTMSWIPPAIYKSSCSIDVQYFPFDQQVCEMKFGSWTFLDNQLNFTFYKNVSHLDVSDYLVNGAWDIVEGNAEITKVLSGNNGRSKAMVIFKLILRRKTLFYTVNLIIPCVLISFVTLSVFILPADAGEKITLAISILLALVVFLLLISKILPPSLTIPLISQYLLFTFIMNILAILSTVIVLNRNFQTPRTHRMPMWVRIVFLNYLPRIMLMTRPSHDKRWLDNKKEKKERERGNIYKMNQRTKPQNPDLTNRLDPHRHDTGMAHTDSSVGLETFAEAHRPNCKLIPPPTTGELSQPPSQSMTETTFMENTIRPVSHQIFKAAESVQFIHKHFMKDDDYRTVIDDWRYVARVIDRLLLIIFFIVTTAGTFGILLKAPHILEKLNQDDILAKMNENWDKVKKA